jgi:hypothetical protein
MPRPRVFVTQPIAESALARLRAVADVAVNPDGSRVLDKAKLIEAVKRCDILISLLHDTIDAEVLASNPDLKAENSEPGCQGLSWTMIAGCLNGIAFGTGGGAENKKDGGCHGCCCVVSRTTCPASGGATLPACWRPAHRNEPGCHGCSCRSISS